MSFETEPNADAIDFLFDDTRTLEQRLRDVDSYTAGILERAIDAAGRPWRKARTCSAFATVRFRP
jgi:hypothetical protein